jgi:putative PIN family toxin of toxin-antitoxin system
MLRVVLDTNVLVAAVRSRRGAAFAVLSRVGQRQFDIALSVPLVLEYEEALLRQLRETGLRKSDVEAILDYLCRVGRHQEIHFLWRPRLPDPEDDMVLELAVAAQCEAIVTFNKRDFDGAGEFGVRVIGPVDLLREIGAIS